MAKKAKMEGGAETKEVSAADLKRAVEEISRQKALASEYAGNAGKATQSAVERFGLDKTALTFARRLSDMEDSKRQAVIRASIDYWHKLGFFDQLDAFDDLTEKLSEIADGAQRRGEAKPTADPVVVNLVN